MSELLQYDIAEAIHIGGNWYYVDNDGFAYTDGIHQIQGSVYCFDHNGAWIAQ